MTDTTIIPTGTSGFHSHTGSHNNHRERDELGVISLLLSQRVADEGRSTQKSVFEVALSAERSRNELQCRIDDTRIDTIKLVESAKLETAKLVDCLRAETAKGFCDMNAHLFKMEDARQKDLLAAANAEIQLLRLKYVPNPQ